jgi:hypothetical protein
MYSSYSFMTLVLDGVEWSASSPGRALPPSHSTRGHPRVSTPPSQISMKFGIQYLWTNIITHIFLFSPYWLSFSFYSPLKITLNVGVLQIAAKQRNDTVCFN